MFRQLVERAAPESQMEFEPFFRLFQRFALEMAAAVLAGALVGDECRILQHLQVPRDGGQRDREGLCELAHRGVARAQAREDSPAGRGGEGGESRIELNHLTIMLSNGYVKCNCQMGTR